MSIDTDSDLRINIKDIVVTEPQRRIEGPFDPARLLTQKEWRIADKLLSDLQADEEFATNPSLFTEAFSTLSIINPEMYKKENLSKEVNAHIQACLLEPDRFPHAYSPNVFDLLMLDSDSKKMLRSNREKYNAAEATADHEGLIRIVFPELSVLPDEEVLALFRNTILPKIPEMRQEGGWEYARFLASARYLYPDQFDELVKISSDDWKGFYDHFKEINSDLESADDENKSTILMSVAFYRILAAEKVRVTENGLELDFPTSSPEFTSGNSVPEVRKF